MKKRRLLLICAVGLLSILGALVYLHFKLARPVGSGPAGPEVPREAFAKPWTKRKVLLLGIGDSVTAGYGVPSAYSYFHRLEKNPEDEFEDMQGIRLSAVLPNLRTEQLALSGSTSIQHLDIIQNLVETQPADTFGLVVMTSGGNDLIHDYGRKPPREGTCTGPQSSKPGRGSITSRNA